MTGEQVLDVAQMAVTTLIVVSAPAMLVALLVGLVVALFQALTSIQEMTLTFVPKILLVFITLIFALPFMSDRLMSFTNEMMQRIITGGG